MSKAVIQLFPSHQDYQQELYQLKDEFERYKTRAQSVLKNRGNKVGTCDHTHILNSLCNTYTQESIAASALWNIQSLKPTRGHIYVHTNTFIAVYLA